MNKFDIIILIIVVIILSVIIGININSVINNKLENISVTIPPIKLPEPNIIVKIQKDCDRNDYDVYIEKSSDDKLEHFSEANKNKEEKHVDPYTIKNTEEKLINISEKNISLAPITKKSTQFPDADNIIKYGDYTCYKKTEQPKQEEIKTEEKTKEKLPLNESILLNEYETYKYLFKNNTKLLKDDFDEQINELNYDPAEYFKKHQQFVKSYLDDPIMKGGNIGEYNDVADIYDIGKIKLTKITEYPQPDGYIFNDSRELIEF